MRETKEKKKIIYLFNFFVVVAVVCSRYVFVAVFLSDFVFVVCSRYVFVAVFLSDFVFVDANCSEKT
jgi:hypothetical protein